MPKIPRRFISLSFAAKRAYRKIATTKPSIFIVAIAIVAVSIFFLGGGVYDILEQPLIALPYGSDILYFYPSISEQVISESLRAMISYSFGALGILLMYHSTKYASKPRQAFILMFGGALFFLMAYFLMEELIASKISVGLGS
jgi:predicted neutral ceramidase superfamily lipid hydrolase